MRLANVEPLQQIAAQSLGLSATVLRCVSTHMAHQQLEAIFLMENHDPGWIPPAGWRWVTREALAALPLAMPAQRAVLEICLTEAETDAIPTLWAPWARRGWFAQAQAWIEAQLARLDYVFVPPLTRSGTGVFPVSYACGRSRETSTSRPLQPGRCLPVNRWWSRS
jgi:hypothetical protein